MFNFLKRKKINQSKVIKLKTNQHEKPKETSRSEREMASIISAFDNKYGKAFTPNNQQSKNQADPLIGDFCFKSL